MIACAYEQVKEQANASMHACCDSCLIRNDDEAKGTSQSQSSPIDRHAERQLQIARRKHSKKYLENKSKAVFLNTF